MKTSILTQAEILWLKSEKKISSGYERKIKSGIRQKIKIFQENELPLLIQKGLI